MSTGEPPPVAARKFASNRSLANTSSSVSAL